MDFVSFSLLEEKESKEANLQQIESKYLKEIKELKLVNNHNTHPLLSSSPPSRDVLSTVVQEQEIQQHQHDQLENKLLFRKGDPSPHHPPPPTGQKPDLLTAAQYNIGRESPSLLEEIVATEGATSPALRYMCVCVCVYVFVTK